MIEFTCPRCGPSVSERLYGPCDACRLQLRSSLGSDGHALETAAYDPKMNVTPNAVALKD
jgi:NMD protein affecting ribosome stability and mRNA decay